MPGSAGLRCGCPAPGGGHAAWAGPHWPSTATWSASCSTESIAAVGLQRTWDDVTRPVLSAVAQRWADTGVGIEIEHLLSDCVTGVFGASVSAAPSPVSGARPAMLAGMPRDQHVLPLVVLAAMLAQRGIACRSLGADLPVTAMTTAIRRLAPAAVVLWSQLSSTADPKDSPIVAPHPTGVPHVRSRPRLGRGRAPAASRAPDLPAARHRRGQRRDSLRGCRPGTCFDARVRSRLHPTYRWHHGSAACRTIRQPVVTGPP